jgi:phosphoserine aminotransferase
LIAILSAGYAVVLLVNDALNRATAPPDASLRHSGMLSLVSRSRWFWLPAVYALALLVVLLITLTQQGGVGQMMYRSF